MERKIGMIKNYQTYLKEDVLALPPHRVCDEILPEINDSKLVYTILQIYNMEHRDIINASNRINSILESGTYLRLKYKKHDINFIYQNEPVLVFGMKSGNSFTKGNYSNVKCDTDSIIIYCKTNDVMFVIGVNEFKDYELIFIRPKRVVSDHDPFGEEDWND